MLDVETQATDITADRRFLTFHLAGEEYGLPILEIREIIGMSKLTPVPDSPCFVPGVMNRGSEVIPVIDLRARLGLPSREPDAQGCIIIVTSTEEPTGILVDGVSEVIEFDEDALLPPPTATAGRGGSAVHRVARSGESVRLLLDPVKVIGEGGF